MKYFYLLLSLILSGCASDKGTSDRPNIIIFPVDDMGWSDLGCYAPDDFH